MPHQLELARPHSAPAQLPTYNQKQVDLIKDTVCRGATNEEFEVFLHACRHTKLDPLMKQIYSIPRWDSRARKEIRTVQVSINGKRLIAERTGKYMPGPKPTFTYDDQGKLLSATAYIKRMDSHGHWHVIEGEARLDEYLQTTKEGKPSGLWGTKEHIMLAKCAESIALDRGFPAEMSPIYTHEEMGSMELVEPAAETLKPAQLEHLDRLIALVPDVLGRILTAFEVNELREIKADKYGNICSRLEQIVEERRSQGSILGAQEDPDGGEED